MLYINQIQELLNCTREYALRVMECMQIDFSECTDEQFEKEVRLCNRIIKYIDSNPLCKGI